MEIVSFRTLWGPNVYHNHPVLMMRVDLGDWAETSSAEFPFFKENLMALLPELRTHECSPGRPGGFCERLDRGTYMAHIMEHVALELSELAGIGVNFGKARFAGEKGHYNIITRFRNESGMKASLEKSFLIVKNLLERKPVDLGSVLEFIETQVRESALGPSAASLVKEAQRRKIPVRRVSDNSLYQLGYGKNRRFLQAAVTDGTSLISTEILQDKDQTKKILRKFSIPAPRGVLVESRRELPEKIKGLRFPLVVKPFDGHHGKGVELDLRTAKELRSAFLRARKYSDRILIEEMCRGKDYRVLVVDGKVVAAAERRPPHVEGNGFSTIQTLIEALNTDPRRGVGHENFLTRVEIDDVLTEHLAKRNLSLAHVPAKNEIVVLRGNSNLSSGGTAHDVTESMHPEVRALCERTARLLNIDICGIDLIHHDLSLPVARGLQVIEVNAGPGLRMHLQPATGAAQPVAEKILDMLYPPHANSRIPIVSVTGTNGKTTVTRMIRKILSNTQNCVGMTTTDGIWIGEECIAQGDMTGPISSETVLSDPKVDMAVLEVARGGILRGGLAYDWSDVGVVTNIKADHLGQDGIEDLDDLIWIKSLVAERVREGGWLVLNADDPSVLSLREKPSIARIPKNYFLYSTSPANPALLKHLYDGQAGCWLENGFLCLQKDGILSRILEVGEIPSTLKGKARFQISNALAALAAGFCMGATLEEIRRGLQSFRASMENSGRLNFYRVGDAHVLLDYAHNPEALRALADLVKGLGFGRVKLVASLPGDRRADLLTESAKIMAKSFDHIIVKEEKDLRGRKAGEISDLILKTVARESPALPCEFIADETEALEHALKGLTKKDLVIVLQDELEPFLARLRQYDPIPVDGPVSDDSQERRLILLPTEWKDNVHHA